MTDTKQDLLNIVISDLFDQPQRILNKKLKSLTRELLERLNIKTCNIKKDSLVTKITLCSTFDIINVAILNKNISRKSFHTLYITSDNKFDEEYFKLEEEKNSLKKDKQLIKDFYIKAFNLCYYSNDLKLLFKTLNISKPIYYSVITYKQAPYKKLTQETINAFLEEHADVLEIINTRKVLNLIEED